MSNDGLAFALGKAVRRRRRALGLSQKDFARAAGIHPDTLLKIELGRVQSSYKLSKIARALDVSINELMHEADASSGVMFPDVGRLVRALMEARLINEEQLARAMKVDLDDTRRLIAGDAGPMMWGAAAVVFGVPLRVFEHVAINGLSANITDVDLLQTLRDGSALDM